MGMGRGAEKSRASNSVMVARMHGRGEGERGNTCVETSGRSVACNRKV